MDGQTDNQQAKVSEAERGWVAGFFDGEGSVYMAVRSPRHGDQGHRSKSQMVRPECKISGTDEKALETIHDILTRAGIGHHISWVRPKGATANGQLYRMAWSINTTGAKRVHRLLEWLVDLLIVKRETAELVLAYIRSRLAQPHPQTPITEAEMELVKRVRGLSIKRKPQVLTIDPRRPQWQPVLASSTTRPAGPMETAKV